MQLMADVKNETLLTQVTLHVKPEKVTLVFLESVSINNIKKKLKTTELKKKRSLVKSFKKTLSFRLPVCNL